MLTIYIGYDHREPIAFDVLKFSIEQRVSSPVNIQPLEIHSLQQQGLLTRDMARLDGIMHDLISDAPQSTEFAISRFLPIVLQRTGWGIFMDCDMLFFDDINDIIAELDNTKAIMCVKHAQPVRESIKMDNQPQTVYSRKNWSSFYAFNADHEANRRLNLHSINSWPGRYLHSFGWAKDSEIGELSPGWNWLVNVQDRPEKLYNAHFTLGGPWFPNWRPSAHDELWLAEHERFKKIYD